MTTEQINSGLIQIMRERIPSGMNLARVLMDLLCIGEEAVYRRLRGEVPFTLAEAAIVSGKLGISLDKLVGADRQGNAVFDLNLIKYDDPADTYHALIDNYIELFESIADLAAVETGTAANKVPQVFTMKYETLSKFRFLKWMYQNEEKETARSLDDITLPEKLVRKQQQYIGYVQRFGFTYYVWDAMLFAALIADIKYFVSIGIVNNHNVARLREELMALLEEMYHIASVGKFPSGNEIQIYISNINFEATYSYIEANNYILGLLRVFSLNPMTSRDEEVFLNLKRWIKSLKKFSILISQSGEMQRIQFFNKQREAVATL
ncbi:MAG: hypothetical protein LIO77_03560 [Rikenellaceae bacterium]|nr:hypothetical protein [Rikenellaceae bacterium]